MEEKSKVSGICLLLLLTLLQITTPSSVSTQKAVTTTSTPTPSTAAYSIRPADVKVAVGEPAVFRCGVPKAIANFTFTFYGKPMQVLKCPSGHIENIPQGLSGSCEVKNKTLLAVWTLKGASLSNNRTKVVCHQSMSAPLVAVLHVYDKGLSLAARVGVSIGGFFFVLLVSALLYTALRRSETFQRCFRGKEADDDDDDDDVTIVTKE